MAILEGRRKIKPPALHHASNADVYGLSVETGVPYDSLLRQYNLFRVPKQNLRFLIDIESGYSPKGEHMLPLRFPGVDPVTYFSRLSNSQVAEFPSKVAKTYVFFRNQRPAFLPQEGQ